MLFQQLQNSMQRLKKSIITQTTNVQRNKKIKE